MCSIKLLGGKGAISWAHFDMFHNVYFPVKKAVTLNDLKDDP